MATPSLMVAPLALESRTVKVSLGSRLRSGLIKMVIARLVSPGKKTRVPLFA